MTDRPSPPAEQEVEARTRTVDLLTCPRSDLLAVLAKAKQERDRAQKLFDEWDEWLSEALAALGAETVFDIKKRAKEIKAAEQERDEWKQSYFGAIAEYEAAEARERKLQEALERIAKYPAEVGHQKAKDQREMIQIAKAALQATQEDGS